MPRGDRKHQLIFDELVNILGERYVEDDPAVIESYYRDAISPAGLCEGRHEFIVLPGSTEDVQAIFRLANRYEFPVSVTGTGLFQLSCNAHKDYQYWCFIDPKRMDQIEKLDDDNMYAVIQPYVTIGQLQAVAMKKGLFHGVPGASSQASALAGNVFQNIHWTSWRTGVGRNLLGVEWVLPSGDVFRTGSLAMDRDNWFWGEGPGPDARGILRGHTGHLGSLGVVTKIAVKLHTWPGPAVIPTEGVQPEKKALLPPEKFRTFAPTFPSIEASVDFIAEMGKEEIAGYVMKFGPWDFVCWYTSSFEEFWKEWDNEYWTNQKANGHMVAVGLWGVASDKQVEYEEKVLMHLIKKYGGVLPPADIAKRIEDLFNVCTVRDTYRHRFTRLGKVHLSGNCVDSLYDTIRSGAEDRLLKNEFTPPLHPMGPQLKFWSYDFGRTTWTEIDSIAERYTEESDRVGGEMMQREVGHGIQHGTVNALYTCLVTHVYGPHFCNVHQLFGKIKHTLDPKNIANPTRIVDMRALEGQV